MKSSPDLSPDDIGSPATLDPGKRYVGPCQPRGIQAAYVVCEPGSEMKRAIVEDDGVQVNCMI